MNRWPVSFMRVTSGQKRDSHRRNELGAAGARQGRWRRRGLLAAVTPRIKQPAKIQ
jgi:hypothetical protein